MLLLSHTWLRVRYATIFMSDWRSCGISQSTRAQPNTVGNITFIRIPVCRTKGKVLQYRTCTFSCEAINKYWANKLLAAFCTYKILLIASQGCSLILIRCLKMELSRLVVVVLVRTATFLHTDYLRAAPTGVLFISWTRRLVRSWNSCVLFSFLSRFFIIFYLSYYIEYLEKLYVLPYLIYTIHLFMKVKNIQRSWKRSNSRRSHGLTTIVVSSTDNTAISKERQMVRRHWAIRIKSYAIMSSVRLSLTMSSRLSSLKNHYTGCKFCSFLAVSPIYICILCILYLIIRASY